MEWRPWKCEDCGSKWDSNPMIQQEKCIFCDSENIKHGFLMREGRSQMEIEQIAKVCHEVNRAYCLSIGDDSQQPWEEAPQWQKDSAINGVNYHLDNNVTPEQSHENWLKQKLDEGWVYGKVKDPALKTHPCMM